MLPALIFTGSQATAATWYRLQVEPQPSGPALERTWSRPRRSLRPGELAPGACRCWFEADAGRGSPRTWPTVSRRR